MFKVYVDDGNLNIDELENICYIVSKNGTFLRKNIGITDALVKVNNISHLNSSVNTFGRINVPRIPQNHFSKIVKFFKWAYEKYNGESVVLIYYNRDLNMFDIYPTDQEVSSASASYTREGLSHTGFLLVGTIHSHANFSASHSSVDNDDELNFDGVHITVGHVNDTYQSISCSVVVNGQRFMYDPNEYIDGVVQVNINDSSNNVNPQKTQTNVVKPDERYLVKGLTSADFDEDWKDKVQKRIRQQYRNQTIINGYGGLGLFGFDYENYGVDYIDRFRDIKSFDHYSEDKTKNRGPFDDFTEGNDFTPCQNCIYRNYKIKELLGGMFDEDEIMYLLGEGDIDDHDEDNEETE